MRRYDRRKFPPPGASGGMDGGASKFVIRACTMEEEETPAAGRFELCAGEKFYLQSAGGGGFGEPKSRAAERLARDLEEGYVSEKAAKDFYGR